MRRPAGCTSRSRTTAKYAADEEEGGGTGVGLSNVCDRLVARYGDRAGCLAGADPDGGYTVHLYMPVVQDEPRRCGSWWSTTSRSRSSGCNCCSPGWRT